MSASGSTPLVFLSYSHKDSTFVIRLRKDLQAQGIGVWVDKEDIQVGTPDWDQALRNAIQASHAVLYIASPSARASYYVKDELRLANLYQRTLFPIWVKGDHWMEAAPIGLGGMQFIDAREYRYQTVLPDIVQSIHHAFNKRTTPPPEIPPSDFNPRNPYKGLRAFQLEDAHDFFGRTHLIHELLQAVQQMLARKQQYEASARLLAVIGASGSGKSSVVMAGLLFQLKDGILPGSRDWLYLDPVLPGKHPIEALTLILSRHFPARSLTDISKDLTDESTRGLHLLLASLMKKSEAKAVLFIDQFEELFIQTNSKERQLFLDILITAVTEPAGPAIMVLTLRADFYDRLLQHSEIGRLIDAHHIVAFPMEIDDFREIIERPARLHDVHLTFEMDLMGDLLFDTQGQSGALPLLQFTLDQLFQQREGYFLTRRAYQNLGGVKGALARHAEETFLLLPSSNHQRLARALFLRLIDAGTLEQDATRRRASLSELTLMDPNETTILQEVARIFITARLLTTKTIADTILTVEVSHEALISQWKRLRDWLDKAYEDIRLQKRISEDADTWLRMGKPTDRLYQDAQLVETQDWRKQNIPSQSEEIFIQESIARHEREKAAEKQLQRHYRRRTILVGIGGVTLAAAVAVPLSLYVSSTNNNHSQTHGITINGKISYTGHNAAVSSVHWSPDSKYIVTASHDRTVQILSVSINSSTITMVQTYKNHNNTVFTANWSPDSQRIVSTSLDKTVQIWEAAPYNRGFNTAVTDLSCNVSWSPDSKYVTSLNKSQKLQIWNASTGASRQISQGPTSQDYVAWSPNGKYIASVSVQDYNINEQGYNVQIWDVSDGTLLVQTRDTSISSSVSWSPNSQKIAAVSLDKTVQVWDIFNHVLLCTYAGHTDFVQCVSWSPDSKSIASGGHDNTVQVWNAANATHIQTYTGHTDFVQCVSWTADSKSIASGGYDNIVQVWNATNAAHIQTYTGHTNSVQCVSWSPDGKSIVSTDYDQTMQVWEALSGRNIQILDGYTEACWSPDGKSIASIDIDNMVHIRESLPYIYKNHTNYVYSASWSPDGKYIASAGLDKTVQIWRSPNSNDMPLLKYIGHHDAVVSVAWSPYDGKYIASAGWDNTVQVWEALSGKMIQTYRGHIHAQKFFLMQGANWSPDGKYIASAGGDKTVQVWEALTGNTLQIYTGYSTGVGDVSWSPDGKYIVFASGDKTVQIWEALKKRHIQTYKGHSDIVSSVNWSPDGKYIVSAGGGNNDHTVQVWSVQIPQ